MAEPALPDAALGAVTVEAVAWVTRFVGGSGTSRLVFREPLQPHDTVRSVLRRFAARHPQLNDALWDRRTGDLGEHIEVMVRGGALGIYAGLDSEVGPQDTITLLGQFMGG